MMHWYKLIAIISLGVFLFSTLFHVLRLIRLGRPVDYSSRAGDIRAAVAYSFTGAMSPVKKESAFLHLPTYTAGLAYHLGTFLSVFIFFLLLFGVKTSGTWPVAAAVLLLITFGCGTGILIKRAVQRKLRNLSNPDDYISNALVSLFQFMTALVLVYRPAELLYYLVSALLLLYFPVGKLKHAYYFFAARWHLGFFYGWRGVWPPKPYKRS